MKVKKAYLSKNLYKRLERLAGVKIDKYGNEVTLIQPVIHEIDNIYAEEALMVLMEMVNLARSVRINRKGHLISIGEFPNEQNIN